MNSTNTEAALPILESMACISGSQLPVLTYLPYPEHPTTHRGRAEESEEINTVSLELNTKMVFIQAGVGDLSDSEFAESNGVVLLREIALRASEQNQRGGLVISL
jgi:hypothetical protein